VARNVAERPCESGTFPDGLWETGATIPDARELTRGCICADGGTAAGTSSRAVSAAIGRRYEVIQLRDTGRKNSPTPQWWRTMRGGDCEP